MIYARYMKDGAAVFGTVENGLLCEIKGDIYGKFEHTGQRTSVDGTVFLPPSEPTKIVAVGKNYLDHINEFGGPVPDEPVLFLKPPSAITAHEGEIVLPDFSERVDYEGELAFIIKKTAKNVKAEDYREYISGFTCLNDVTARDIQASDGQWARAKGIDTFAPFGPFVSDEIDPDNVDIKTLLNGAVMQDSNTRHFIWKTAALLEFITRAFTLCPGDVVTTGTPSGVGMMKSGDVVEVCIQGIGTLRNRVK